MNQNALKITSRLVIAITEKYSVKMSYQRLFLFELQ